MLPSLIFERYHVSLHRALPLIRAELDRLSETQSAPPRSLAETRAAFADLAHELEGHLAKEENVLFPALEALALAKARPRAGVTACLNCRGSTRSCARTIALRTKCCFPAHLSSSAACHSRLSCAGVPATGR